MSEYKWIGYTPVAVSSEAQGTSIQELANSEKPSAKSWECGRFDNFPQEIVLRLDARAELSHIVIQSKHDRHIPHVKIQLGDGLCGSFVDAEYYKAGKAENITTAPKQIITPGIGSYVKLVFNKRPGSSQYNPHGQISIATLKIWGREVPGSIPKGGTEVKRHTDQVDNILLKMGVPLEMLMWSHEDHQSYKYAPVDEDSRETLIELDLKKQASYEQEDYGALKHLTRDIKTVYQCGNEILSLKRELAMAVTKEDFVEAKRIKQELDKLGEIRDNIDALYETARYERMVRLGKPSDAHMAWVNQLLEQERLEAERLRKLREDELERHRRYLEELERKRRAEEEARNRQTESPVKVQKSPPRRVVKKEAKAVKVETDIYEYNEGDVDLEPYLRPKINQAGGNVSVMDRESLKRADAKQFLRVIGVRLWSAIFGENWRHRYASAMAMLEFSEAPLLPKYVNDTRNLFRACVHTAAVACDDRILAIYLVGLKILITAMQPPICDNQVTPKMINAAMKMFIPIMLSKVSELNYRARDISMHTLIELFRHPKVKIGPLVEYILLITAPTEEPPEKQPWRVILARIEILLHIVQEFGVDEQEWNWKEVFHKLICPCFQHRNGDIRQACVEFTIALYQRFGLQVRKEVDNLGKSLKPALTKQIFARMLDMDTNQNPGENNMNVIHETQEWAEQTPPGSAKANQEASNQRRGERRPTNWAKLKDMITKVQQEEESKLQ